MASGSRRETDVACLRWRGSLSNRVAGERPMSAAAGAERPVEQRRAVTVPSVSIRNYAVVTAAYWAFTLTDGALRMLVLLHFNRLGYTPVQLAFLFLLYEAFGIVTNLLGGWVAARTGLRLTLLVGLALQVIALAGLALLN